MMWGYGTMIGTEEQQRAKCLKEETADREEKPDLYRCRAQCYEDGQRFPLIHRTAPGIHGRHLGADCTSSTIAKSAALRSTLTILGGPSTVGAGVRRGELSRKQVVYPDLANRATRNAVVVDTGAP